MKNHYSPIITNARQGKAVSTANHKRGTVARPWLLILAGCAAFWAALIAILFVR